MRSVTSLAAYLGELTREQLTALVTIRRDATIEPAPKTPVQLAERLLDPASMVAACGLLTLPQLQVVEATVALGDGCTAARLAALLGVPEDDPDLAVALRRLADLAFLWPQAGGLAVAHLSQMWPHPLDLGPRAADLLISRDMGELRRLAKLYGVTVSGRGKAELIDALASWLAQPENVRRLMADAPDDVRTALAGGRSEIMFGSPGMTLPWARDRGLVVSATWGVNEMPREVELALRKDYQAPFTPRPPAMSFTPVPPETVRREASAAATETLTAITAIVEVMSGGPVPLLRTGGLGVRELRRLAKASGQDEDRTRLTVELLAASDLVTASETGVTPSTAYDEFNATEPADRLLDIVGNWLTMPACPLGPGDTRALYWSDQEELFLVGLRGVVMRALSGVVPEGQAIDAEPFARRVRWESPVLTAQVEEDLPLYVTGIWREAHRLGLLAHGTLTGLGRVLMTGDHDTVRAQAEAMLPRSRDSVTLQNDLTAVVTGTPSAGLLALLDSAATPESRSGAWTWRFSATSIRAALDAGNTAEDLIARITGAAEGGRVPRTLTYLIDDVARRHGRVQVRPAGCCLCSDDETLLTEILHTRSLGALKLVKLAPTVLVSVKPQAETLAALRAAGFAPAALDIGGSPAIEVPQRRRAVPRPDHEDIDGLFGPPALSDPAEMARTLLGRR